MSCFNHHGKPAIGICRGCMKFLCKECGELKGNYICCKEQVCQERVSDEEEIMRRSKITFGIGTGAKKPIFTMPVVCLLLGSMLSFMGFYLVRSFSDFHSIFSSAPIILIGMVFALYGLFNILKKDRLTC